MSKLMGWLRGFGGFVVSVGSSAIRSVRSWSPARCALVALGAAALIAAAVLVDVPSVTELRAWAEHLGPWFVAAFFGAYVLFTQFPIPRTVWTVAAGVLFGPWVGLGISLAALTVSAAISLLVVRWLLGEWIRPHLGHPAVLKINAHLERRGWLAIGSLRMVAGVPFSLLNYVAALTPIPVGHFVIATLVGSIPTTALGVFFGDALSGEVSPWAVVALVFFAAAGLAGLVVDARVPTCAGRGKPVRPAEDPESSR